MLAAALCTIIYSLEVILFKVRNKETWKSATEYVNLINKNALQIGTVKLM